MLGNLPGGLHARHQHPAQPCRASQPAPSCQQRAAPMTTPWRHATAPSIDAPSFGPCSPHAQPCAAPSRPQPVHMRNSHVAHGHVAVTPPDYNPSTRPPARLAAFVSGGGSNMKAIHAAIKDGRVNGQLAVVVSDVPTCGGVEYAYDNGIPVLIYPIVKKGEFQGQGLTAAQLVDGLVNAYKVDAVLLAGYLKLIPPELCRAFRRAMLNIHPGLLPSFGGKGYYGERVHKAVLASGARVSGPTVHFVDEEFDTGPILAQRVVPVYPDDSYSALAARVLKEEHQVYPECVSALCDGRITWREDGVPILWKAY